MSSDFSTATVDDQGGNSGDTRRTKRYVPGWPVWTIIAILVVTGFSVQLSAEQLTELLPAAGRAFANILMIPLVLTGVVTILCWLLFRSSYIWWLKLLVVAGVLSFPFVFKIQHSGDLFSFHLQLRWFSPDQFLDLPVVARSKASRPAISSEDPLAFPEFNGPRRTGKLSGQRLASWETNPPELVWRQEVGAGWSAFSAAHGIAVTQEQRGDRELVTAYDIASGDVLWFHAESNTRHDEEMGGVGPRATPTIDGDRVFAQGATGVLVCLDFATGELLWRRDIVRDVGSDRETDKELVVWGRSGSPLVVGDRVVVPGGGKSGSFVSLIAYDRETGDEVWRGGTRQISYASPVLMNLAGRDQIVIVNEGSVSGHDPESGDEWWSYGRVGHSSADANTSQPRKVDANHLLVTKGYSLGAELLELNNDPDGNWTVERVWANSRVLRTKLTSVVVEKGYAYGLNEGILECVDLADGQRVWKSGRFRHGQILMVGDDLIVLGEDGALHLLAASPNRPKISSGIPAVQGITWNNLCLWGEYLLVRNSREAACFRIKVQPVAGEAARPEEPVIDDGPANSAG